jgi:AICAR transformylase/IMP cyclohydrolase PurH
MELNFGKVPFIALGVRDGYVYSAGFSYDLDFEALSNFSRGGVFSEVPSGLFICNFSVSKMMAESLIVHSNGKRNLITAIICPGLNKNAIPVLKGKNENFTILTNSKLSSLGLRDVDTSIGFKHIRGGFISYTNYPRILHFKDVKRYGRDKNILHIESKTEYYKDLVLAWAITEASARKSLAVVHNARLIANACADAGHTTLAKLAIMIAEDSMSSLIGSCVSCNNAFNSREAVEMLLVNGVINLLTYDCPDIVYLFTNDKITQLFQI